MKPVEIYGLIDPRSGVLRYVGKTVSGIKIRLKQHIHTAKGGGVTHRDRWIRSLLNENLKPSSVILEAVGEGADWETAERFWISFYRGMIGGLLTNISDGGDGVHGVPRTEQWRERMSAAMRGKKRKPISEAHRAALSAFNTGRKLPPASEEKKAKLRAANLGKKNGPPSAETRAKISAATKGKKQPPLTPEQRERWVAGQIRGETHHQAKLTIESVIAIRNESAGGKALASKYGVSYSTIKMVRRRAIWTHI